MDSPSIPRCVTRKSKKRFCPTGSSSDEVEIIDVMESGSSSTANSKRKLKQIQVVPDVIEIDGDDSDGTSFIGDKFIIDKKGKDPLASPIVFPTSEAAGPMSDISQNSDDLDLEDESSDYDCDELIFDEDAFDSYNESLLLQAQFDAADLPPGAEASIPWMENPTICQKKSVCSTNTVFKEGEDAENQKKAEADALEKLRRFKQFETVQDFSDHHYTMKAVAQARKTSKKWTKTIQQDWKLLEHDLPETIFVRVYEERMDLLRAAIIGAEGTPYHDGLFFFDVFFPTDYPDVPPQVHYHSGGLRINPNLYNCGKVCLSLLNTWQGETNTRWTPGKSTMLQVLLSIQALVLNAKPYFNEPGYERTAGSPDGEKRSQAYTENTFILSCRTMLYTLNRPPKYFEDLVLGHFCLRGHKILAACKAYIEGAQVGCVVDGVQDVDEGDKSGSQKFKQEVSVISGNLVPIFIQIGARNCEQFICLGDMFRLEQANYSNIMRKDFYKKPGETVVETSSYPQLGTPSFTAFGASSYPQLQTPNYTASVASTYTDFWPTK